MELVTQGIDFAWNNLQEVKRVPPNLWRIIIPSNSFVHVLCVCRTSCGCMAAWSNGRWRVTRIPRTKFAMVTLCGRLTPRTVSGREPSPWAAPTEKLRWEEKVRTPRTHLGHNWPSIPKTIGNRKRDCAWGGSGWWTLPEKIYRSQSTNQSAELNERLPDLCFAICRFFQVRFITPSHLTHNLFFYFQ